MLNIVLFEVIKLNAVLKRELHLETCFAKLNNFLVFDEK